MLSLLAVITYLDRVCIAVAGPRMQDALHISPEAWGWVTVFLSFAYSGILFQQPTLCALCLDVGRKNAGAVFGFMNTAANAASALSAVVFGYLAGYFGNYNTPFISMVALLSLGALLWLQVDPTLELFQISFPTNPYRPGPPD